MTLRFHPAAAAIAGAMLAASPAFAADPPTSEIFHTVLAGQYGLNSGIDYPPNSDTPISRSWTGEGGSASALSNDLLGGTVEATATADDTSTDMFFATAIHTVVLQVQCLAKCAATQLVPIHLVATLSSEADGNASAFAIVNFQSVHAGGGNSIGFAPTGVTNPFEPYPTSNNQSLVWDGFMQVRTNYILDLEAQVAVHMGLECNGIGDFDCEAAYGKSGYAHAFVDPQITIGDGFADLYRLSGGEYGSIPDVGSAPEPGTWSLMLAGFGLAGVALRRHGRVARRSA